MSGKCSWNLVIRIDTANADKPYWHTIGRAWENERNPGSIKIKLNSLPIIPTTDLYLFPIEDRDHGETRSSTNRAEPLQDHTPPHSDDEIPF